MSTLVAERRLVDTSHGQHGGKPIRTDRPTRAPRRRNQARGPAARPLRVAPAPSMGSNAAVGPRACLATPDRSAPSWRLTDRGVAVILVVGLMLAVAALTVIGLTALRVTSPTSEPNIAAPISAIDRAVPGF